MNNTKQQSVHDKLASIFEKLNIHQITGKIMNSMEENPLFIIATDIISPVHCKIMLHHKNI